jgi:hypothetical protein
MRKTLRTPDKELIGYVDVPDDATPEEIQELAEWRVAEIKIEAARDAVQRDVGRPAPPPPRSYGGAKDPLDDKIRCTSCPITAEPIARRDLMAHLKAHEPKPDADDAA